VTDKLPALRLLSMASEIFGIAAIFWVLIPLGLAAGALLLKVQGD
jgi:cytochrome b6-f complex subunit 7